MGRAIRRSDPEIGNPRLIFTQTPLPGAWLIDVEPRSDARGCFARTVCRSEFAQVGLDGSFVQQSISWNPNRGTLRGMHYQAAPFEEDKLVRVTRGAIFDVIVDLRIASPMRGRWFAVDLTAENRRQIYVPKGFAHGFQTTEPDTEVLYEMTVPYQPEAVRGVRWDDPHLGIVWPAAERRLISDKDEQLPPYWHT